MFSFFHDVYDSNIGHSFSGAQVNPDSLLQKIAHGEGLHDTPVMGGWGNKVLGFLRKNNLKIWIEGFDNATFAASHRVSPSSPQCVPFIMFGPTQGQVRWSTDRIYERIKANYDTMTELLFAKPDNVPDQNLEDSLNIPRRTSIDNSKIDKFAKDEFILSGMLHDLRQFFKDHHKFLVHTCLNNEIKADIVLKHGPREGNRLVGPLDYHLATQFFSNMEVIPVSSADILDLESSFDDLGGTEASLNEEGGESSIVPTESSKVPQTRVEKRKRRKAKHKASDSGHPVQLAGVQDENLGRQAESTTPEIAGPEVENGPTLVADETPAVVSTLDSVVAEGSALEFPEFINAPEASATSDVAVPAEAAPKVAAVNSAPTSDSGSVSNDMARVIAQLRAQSPPPSMPEARARRASIKQERRESIEFIRSRTSSRASAAGRPSGLSLSTVPPAASRMPRALEQTAGPLSGEAVVDELVVGPVSVARPEPTGAAELVKAPKRGKWVAPLPEDQEWRVISPAPGIPGGSTAPAAPKKKSKTRRAANPGAQSHITSASSAEIGLASTSEEVGTAIAEDFASGPGPVASRDDESAGHGNTKRPPSITSRESLQSDLELTSKSIVEDSASEQSRGAEQAQGRLTKAALTTSHNTLITELIGAGVPSSALASFGGKSSHLKAYEAAGRQSPVAVRALEVQTFTIGEVTFETPRRGCGHRRAQSMPELSGDASPETLESGGDSGVEVLAGSPNPDVVGNLGPVMANTIASDPVRRDLVVSSTQFSPETPLRQFTGVSLVRGLPLVAAPGVASPSAAPAVACSVMFASGSELFNENDPAQGFMTSLPDVMFWNGKNMSSAEVVSVLGARLPRPLTIEDHPLVNVFLRARHTIGCTFCGLATTESLHEGPAWKQAQACPGCGPASEVRYCDVSCLLADIPEHAKVCGTLAASWPVFWARLPQRYQEMMPPLRPVTGLSVSPECHRQMIYSMLVHDVPVRNPYWKWVEVHLTPEERDEMGRRIAVFRAGDRVEPGDYFLFEPTPAPELLPDLIPMAYMVIRFARRERTVFNRVLNVAFLNRVPAAVNFIHRMLFDHLDRLPSDRISLRRNRLRLCIQLQQEFPEFGVFAEPRGRFEFGREWKQMEPLVHDFECNYPLLRAWCRDDPARQQRGGRRSSVWSRFVHKDLAGMIDDGIVTCHPVPRGLFPAGYYGVEPCVYEAELQGMYMQRVEAALRRVGW